MGSEYGFHVADYIIFAAMISFSIGIGFYSALSDGRQKTTLEYLVGNRELKMLPVALSLVASYESSILILGYPAETYIYGVMLVWSSVSLMISTLLAARIAVPLFHPLKLKSVYEVRKTFSTSPFNYQYFELRYKSRAPRNLGTILGMLYQIFFMGIVLYGPAIALEAVTDFPFWASVVSAAAAAMIYTSIGGLKAVVWTDVLQCVIMTLGIVAVIIKGSIEAGGITQIWNINKQNLRLNFFDFNPDPLVRHTFWPLTVGTIIYYFTVAFNQTTVQRISSVRTVQEANRIIYLSGPVFMIFSQLVILEGLVIFAYFNIIGCDPIKAGYIDDANQLVPYMVVRSFKNLPGLAGLFLASLFSASLSTISSGLSSLSAQTVEDFIKPMFPRMSDQKATVIAKLSVLFYGTLSVGITALTSTLQGSLIQISTSVLTCVGGPLTGLFLFSAFCPWATKKGFLIGGLLSMAFLLWISIGSSFISSHPKQPWLPPNPVYSCTTNSTIIPYPTLYNDTQMRISTYWTDMASYNDNQHEGLDKLYSISYRWLGTIGMLSSIILGSIVSLITGFPKPDDVDARVLLPMGDVLFPYLPKTARSWLEFGVDFKQRTKWLKETNEEGPKQRVYHEVTEFAETTDLTENSINKNEISYSQSTKRTSNGDEEESNDTVDESFHEESNKNSARSN